MNNLINVGELIKRIIKYLVMGVMIAIVTFCVPKRSINMDEIILIALTAASTFAILDNYLPSISSSAKNGLGLGIGLGLSGLAL
jgi:ABC-type Co2+ transport system permease subunit